MYGLKHLAIRHGWQALFYELIPIIQFWLVLRDKSPSEGGQQGVEKATDDLVAARVESLFIALSPAIVHDTERFALS